jgi:hypothetical protein
MSRHLVAEALPEFIIWLNARRPLGFCFTPAQLAVSDQETTWLLNSPARNAHTLRKALAAVAGSGHKAWAENATSDALDLVRSCAGVELAQLSWLMDLTTAKLVADPDYAAETTDEARPPTPLARSRKAAIDALKLQESVTPQTGRAILTRTSLDCVWRHRQLLGIRIDKRMLTEKLDAVMGERAAAARLHGIDLLADNTDAGKAAIHAWLAAAGIFIRDANDHPSLERRDCVGTIIPEHPLAQAKWAEFRRIRRFGSTAPKLWELSNATKEAETVFPQIKVQGAKTGRGSIIKPSLGNVNRELRGLLIARHGYTFVSLDLTAAEPSIAAVLSGDAVLSNDLRTSDVYMALAASIFGELATKSDRDAAKTAFLAILYGRGAKSLARQLAITVEQARSIIANVKRRYTRLAEWAADLQARARAGEQLHYPNGRPLPYVAPDDVYKVVNYMVQGHASDFFYEGVLAVARELGPEALALPVHDELVVEVPLWKADAAAHILSECMCREVEGTYIGGQATILGRRWAK